MTKFAFEVPIAHLNDFEPYQDFTFALSFLLENPVYSEWVVNQCLRGNQTVFIDNSFNETQVPVTPLHMAKIYEAYYPTAVIAPDCDSWDYKEVTEAYWQLGHIISPYRIMGIFKNYPEWFWLMNHSCAFKALSYWWRKECQDEFLHDATQLHYLGLGSLQEVLDMPPRTLDTSIPIKMAIKGIRFEDWVADGGVYTKVGGEQLRGDYRLQRAYQYFNATLTNEQLNLAVHNIQALKAVVNA